MPTAAEKALAVAEKGKQAALGRIRRITEREAEMKAGAFGIGSGYVASRWWAKRRADVTRGTKERAGWELGGFEIDGTRLGAGVAIVGAMGLLGDDLYDDIAYATGISVMAADQAIDAYETRLAEPPAE